MAGKSGQVANVIEMADHETVEIFRLEFFANRINAFF